MSVKIRLKSGAPVDDKLFLRISVQRTWQPKLGPNHYPAIVEEGPNGEDVVELAEPKSFIEVLNYDKHNSDNGYASVLEIIEAYEEEDEITHQWEIVDALGNVWSEYYEEVLVEEPAGPPIPGHALGYTAF